MLDFLGYFEDMKMSGHRMGFGAVSSRIPSKFKYRFLLSSVFQLAQACYMERVDLSAHGFYITPDIGFDWIAGKGSPFNYFTYGAAFAEVEIYTLTGDFHTRTADIVMDLGYSINPAIDIGQVCLHDTILNAIESSLVILCFIR